MTLKRARFITWLTFFGTAFLLLILKTNWAVAIFLGLMVALWERRRLRGRLSERPDQAAPEAPKKASPAMLAHYRESGLSEDDITLFRSTMATAEKQIDQLQRNMDANAKLHTIDLNQHTLRVAQAIFKELVAHPQRLNLASEFLYKHLPSLVDLSGKYLKISQYEVKNDDTYAVLDQAATVINALSQQLQEDYTELMKGDLKEADDDISVAKDSLSDTEKEALKMSDAMSAVNRSYAKQKEAHHDDK
ncbi:hypothetical protein IV38_GL000257 [Lactobacillus selangorensis]|uniref:5-bromo-4-chloroindolyl phosphate hydrolysis protein n=1 Tax=Lactobacillus selangorensis TaxID=81857 RepID=A0A0R2FWQ8_9LACO|nr:5-bromo-4-chloroindolyl phosphate hydrolysis family protein [Lactobacillus selangorensis]KRN29373.1 hypothetical protein IV38_GL000257 [Lactobacillus selangorensis]KRN34098.1 hypothetical protein IV40_GL000412 [Lactobacillus selangorensis]